VTPILTQEPVTLPSGRTFDLYRSRWDGVLDHEEFEYCRQHGIPIAYDCAQIGWVTQTFRDESIELPSYPVPTNRAAASMTMDLESRAIELRHQLAKEAGKLQIEVSQHRLSLDLALERLEFVAATAMKQLAKAFSLADCDLCHWGLKSAMAEFLGTLRGPLQLRPNGSDSKAFEFRPWAPDDAEIYTELLGNERVWQYLPEPFPSEFTTETARTLIEVGAFSFHHEAVAIEVERRNIGKNLLRFDGPSDGVRRPIGQCLLRFDRPLAGVRASEVAYWLGEEHWGQGWMSRVLPEFTYRSFRRHSIDVIYAWIMEDNKASIRVAERAGYRREPFALESQIAESLRRPGFVRYATYRVDWMLDAAEES